MQTASVHWTTYVQTFAVIASTIGTFVYVYFTYHIMKWAVGQGQAARDVAKLTSEQEANRRFVAMDRVATFCEETRRVTIDYVYLTCVAFHTELPTLIARTKELSAGIEVLLALEISLTTRRKLLAMRSVVDAVEMFRHHDGQALNAGQLISQHESVVKMMEWLDGVANGLWAEQFGVDPLMYNERSNSSIGQKQ
jgi:tryptophan synthase alpha subunit